MKQKPYDHLFPMCDHKEETVQYVLDNMDFDKILKFMKKVKWMYGKKSEEKSPTIGDLHDVIKRVLNDGTFFSDKYSSNCGCGGFQFEYTPGWLSVRFGYDRWWKLYKNATQVAQAKFKSVECIVSRLDIGRPDIKEIEFKKGNRRFGLKIGNYFCKRYGGAAYTKKEVEIIKDFLEHNYHEFNNYTGGL